MEGPWGDRGSPLEASAIAFALWKDPELMPSNPQVIVGLSEWAGARL